MDPRRGSIALAGSDEYVWNHTFVVTTQKLVIGGGVLIMIFDDHANLKWAGKETGEEGKIGQGLVPGDNVVVYDAIVSFH